MKEYLSVDRDANAIRMRRSTFFGTFLLVEGSSDKSFYERFVDRAICVLVVISGNPSRKDRVIEVLGALQKSNFHGILAIVDADFDRLEGFLDDNPDLFRTDLHDLETMLINSPALDKVIAEFGSEDKITRFGQDIRTLILENGVIVGHLRWISKIDGLNLTFNGITFSNGDPIPEITDQSLWNAATGPAWCYYNNDSKNGKVYGKLYHLVVLSMRKP